MLRGENFQQYLQRVSGLESVPIWVFYLILAAVIAVVVAAGLWIIFGFLKHKPRRVFQGTYHKRGTDEQGGNYRLHLRVEPDGSGVLIINASRVVHLNPTAAEYAGLVIHNYDEEKAVRMMTTRYKVKPDVAREDWRKMVNTVTTLASTGDICPVSFLDLARIEPFSTPVSAPYRLDLALTYRCNDTCPHCYVGKPREVKELTTTEWKTVIDHTWKAGIPHICFTGGEPTVREDLAELIAHAEELGVVTGLLTNGRLLSDKVYLQKLLEAGLDHIQITLESHDAAVHDQMVGCPGAWQETVQGIKNAVATDVYTITNTTLTKLNTPEIEKTLEFIKSLGITVFACNGIIYSGSAPESGLGIAETEMVPIIERIRDKAKELDLRFIWYTPTQYCNLNPMQLEVGIKACTAAKYNMCVEPDGEVLPCQSFYQSCGNILHDPWEKIWNSQVCRDVREKRWLPAKCKGCEDLPVCGGGCPLEQKNETLYCIESASNG
jgi:radical SAM protein with 4Fe4S-binding SPASM domain